MIRPSPRPLGEMELALSLQLWASPQPFSSSIPTFIPQALSVVGDWEAWPCPWQHPCSHRTVVGMTSAARRVLRRPAAWEEKRPRTEKVVMAASFRSGGSRGRCEWRLEIMFGLAASFRAPLLSDPTALAGWALGIH